MKKNYWLVVGLCLALVACKESQEEKQARLAFEQFQRMEKTKRDLQNAQKEAEKKRSERDAKGDTVAIESTKLESFLPQSFEGYKKEGAPNYSAKDLNGSALSSIEQAYAQGEKIIRVVIQDVNQGVGSHVAQSKVWQTTRAINSRAGSGRYVFWQNKYHAWEAFGRRENKATLKIAVSDRVYVEVNGYHQPNTSDVKAFAEQIDLKRLARY